MPRRSNRVEKRRGYHHGNLKEALVAAARRLIAERGPAGFTLIEAARLAGVSAAAPYRHFADREALIAEVSRRGFTEFADRLEAASKEATTPVEAFVCSGEAYLAFARSEPGYYAAMFSGSPAGPPPDGDRAFGGLEQSIARIAGQSGKRGDAVRAFAYQVWALAHGIATLAGAGRLPASEPPEKLLRAGVEAMIKGSLPR